MGQDTLDETPAAEDAVDTPHDQSGGVERLEVHHKPHPTHGWREVLNEILVIMLGVLIALGLEQFVEALHWSHKVAQAEENMRVELGRDRTDAAQYAILATCTDRYLDRMRDDLLNQDKADLARLQTVGEPFVTEPWTATAWDAAVASQIGDHMATGRFLNYAEAFRRADLMKEVQFRLRDHFAAAMVGRFGVGGGEAQAAALTAAELLRRDITLARAITSDFVANTDALNITPSAAGAAAYQKTADRCVAALPAGPPVKAATTARPG
jgi:hypothetical protein